MRCARAFALVSALASPALADEGMWPFDHPPTSLLEARYGFAPDAEWLEHLRLSAVNVGGASGSLVSAHGLVLTNHHVSLSCLQRLSRERRDLVRDGYVAHGLAEELPCPGFELRRLESTQDVTSAVQAAIRSRDSEAANAQRKAAIAAIENACARDTGLRCEIDTRYRGATYELLRYKVWTDIRLAFAPEARVGFFGGDPDNFVYPRFALDVALLRIYERGAPLDNAHFLRFSRTGVGNGDLVLAAGHPYSTDRLVTMAQLEEQRDVRFPLAIASAQRERKLLQEFGARSPEAARRAAENLFGIENWLKAMTGEYRALREGALVAKKRDDETLLRKRAADDGPWLRIAAATRRKADIEKEAWAVGYGYRTLFEMAGRIVELVHERALPESERLAAYRESSIPRLLTRLEADVPTYKDLEIARLAGSWEEARALLGDDHPFVREVLGGQSPMQAAAARVEPSRLDRVDVRKRLLEGGSAAVDASDDPLIVLARRVYPLHRRLAKYEEVEIEEPIRRAADEIGRLRFEIFGTQAYPDATGSLRLSFGVVRGYDADGVLTPWHTNFLGMYARHAAFDAEPPFDLPAQWMAKQRDLALTAPLDFVSTLDIIGGNSGSPVVDRKGEFVGVVFDGNLESLVGRFAYTEDKGRAIAVDARAIIEALSNIYGADELVREIRGDRRDVFLR